MHFTKMHGIGNDYIYVDGAREDVKDKAKAAIALSDRHFGIGSDGIIFINPSDAADFEMEMYNADGSRGKMCGNGIRCVAKYVYDRGMIHDKTICIETLSGIKTIFVETDAFDHVVRARVDMGAPVLKPADVPVLIDGDMIVGRETEIAGTRAKITCVSMGNPHCVIFMDEDVKKLNLPEIGPRFEHDPLFPEGVNTEFVNVIDDRTVSMRVWERGSGETLACGTGSCAVAAASFLNGFTGRSLTIHLLGGDLFDEWDEETGHMFMTGSATLAFEGEVDLMAYGIE
ncbi:MAG: diaminopimelate epimerase [Lachnospiraceae bacterium]|nr:diaminopimelate epimerase [Lachnospiraceae bacterium]